MSERTPVGVLVSGAGTNLDALLQACRDPDFPARVALVVSNRRSAHALDVALGWGVPAVALPQADFGGDAAARDREIHERFQAAGVRLVVCAGYDRILSDEFLDAYPDAILNVHPSLLPAFAGGMDAVERALARGVRVTGCTVQLLERGEADGGPIVLQTAVPVEMDDDAATLRRRIHETRVGAAPARGGALVHRPAPARRQPRPGAPRARAGIGLSMRALLSVSDKTGLVEFARGLVEHGYDLIATSSTSRALAEAGVEVQSVADVTGFPEMLDGRVRTLHPAIHAGILARRDDPEHMRQLAESRFEPIDMVVSSLYPFCRHAGTAVRTTTRLSRTSTSAAQP